MPFPAFAKYGYARDIRFALQMEGLGNSRKSFG